MKLPAVDRRTLLIGGGAGVGLVVAFLAWPRREGSPLRPGPREAVFGAFLKIGVDGRVTLAVPQVETGQGIWTGLAQIAADELGAAWESVAVEPEGVPESTSKLAVKIAVSPLARVAAVHTTSLPTTAQLNPDGPETRANCGFVVFAGRRSVTCTLVASLGP